MGSVLREGHSVWRQVHADRAAVLVDGQSYYRAAAHAMASARHSIFLLGWDVHSRIELLRGDDRDALPASLGRRLGALLRRNRNLHAYVLGWDNPVFFAEGRESRLRMFTHWPASRRFHRRYDAFLPQGASHHQKLLLVDDRLVIGGGMDIGRGRWDSSEHLAKDPRRNDPDSPDYNPAHDVMLMSDGEVARSIGVLVRERWKRATGEDAVAAAPGGGHDCWPAMVEPDFTDLPVGISRTLPRHEDQRPVAEIEALHIAAFRAARRWIYIENQYLTSEVLVRELIRRLGEPDGPEIVIALPQNNFGWFEKRTIEVLHFRRIQSLRKADVHDRLRICYPTVPGIGEKQINLHSKVFVIDDELLQIGSSNLTTRSMRLDSECDFAIEAGGDRRVADAIARVRNRLLGEHLCVECGELGAALAAQRRLTELVDEHAKAERCLCRVEPAPGQLDIDIGDGTLIDPAVPITPELLIETFAQPAMRRRARPGLARLVAMLVVCALLAATWRWTPLQEWAQPAALAAMGEQLRESSFAPLAVIAIYLVSAILVLPVTVLILATAMVFGPWLGVVYSLTGSLASAMFMFTVGRVAGRSSVEGLIGRHYRKISDALRNRGLATIVALRMLPVAPFTIVNLAVGVTRVRASDFALGTLIGMAPGTIGLSIFQSQLQQTASAPELRNLVLLAVVSVVVIGALEWLRRHLRTGRRRRDLAATQSS